MRAAQPREVVVEDREANLFQGDSEASNKMTMLLPEGDLPEVGDAGVSIPTLAIMVGNGFRGEFEVQRRPHPDLFGDFFFACFRPVTVCFAFVCI